jgi:hypothetical protein
MNKIKNFLLGVINNFQFQTVIRSGVKGFVTAFLAVFAVMSIPNFQNYGEMGNFFIPLITSAILAGVNGAIQAIWKAITWKTDEQILAEVQARLNK